MATNLIKGQGRVLTPMSSKFQGLNTTNELTEGVAASFPILGIKGSRWHYRFHGEDTVIPNPHNPREYAQTLMVVIIKAGVQLTRTYYPQGSYTDDGANRRPECWSSDNVRPDQSVPTPVSPTCAICPNAQWGSGATPASPKAQACQQRRRVVVVPYGADLTNESGGGPMLLSVPPGSLRDLQDYGVWLKGNGFEACSVVTELRFDGDVAFPKVVFDYALTLSDDEADVILNLRASDAVDSIINSLMERDGPEVDDAAPMPPQAGQTQAQAQPPRSGMQRPARPAPQPTQPAAPPPPPPPPPPPAVHAAPQPNIPPQPGKVGGFAAPPPPTQRAAPPPPPSRTPGARPAPPAAPIATAVAQPAKPPASTRTVRTTAAAQPAQPANGEDQGEPPVIIDGSIGAELDSQFNDLFSRQ